MSAGMEQGKELLTLAESLMAWDPFSEAGMCPKLRQLVGDLEQRSEFDSTMHVFQTLQWRDAIKLHQCEVVERAAGIHREHEYCIGASFYASSLVYGRAKQFAKSRRLWYKLDLQRIKDDLSKPCERHKSRHTCLDAFRAMPDIVLRWRRMWFGLPKADRHARLGDMYRQARRCCVEQQHGDGSSWHTEYKILGVPVCRAAFLSVTGLHIEALQKAREASMSVGRIARVAGEWVGRRPLAYMDARSWLLEYARTHGESSPLNTDIFLPCGHKHFYWSAYVADRHKRGLPERYTASLTRFLLPWRTELPFIKIRSSCAPFTHCGLCDYLRSAASCATDLSIRGRLLQMLGEHYNFQAAQRIAINNIIAQSEREPSELVAMSWDKMDQAKSIVPRVHTLANTQFHKCGSRLVVSLLGILVPGVLSRPLVYTVLEDQSHGADMIASAFLDTLLECTRIIGKLPRRLFLQADNTAKD